MSEPTVEMDGQTLSFEELRRRRGLIRIPHELLMHMTDHSGYVVLGVHTQWDTSEVALMVVHPDLREVPEGCQPPNLDSPVSLWRDLQVVDGQVYARCELRIDDPRVAASRERHEVRAQLQGILDSTAPEVTLDSLLERLLEEARARRPVSADEFLRSLR